ncbi:MAG: transketolase family protein [Oscillospiraceae bacterium]|nr:transketolase family protein [Oscillospiraceae bacterium]MCR5649397.1 transketolase family protein [Oscillospiraceae bacterium]
MFKIKSELKKAEVPMRDAYCNTLMQMAEKDERIVALDADLISSSGMKPFFAKFPERAIQCGIAEANMIGIAAGLSLTGKVPFAHSFGPFASRRVCDQIFISAAYANLNIRILGSDPGVTAAYNGGTHMPFEDMGVLRSIPGITLIEPCDPVAVADIVSQLADVYGVYYMRMARKSSIAVYEPGSTFEIGKGNLLRNGTDVTIIASGIMVAESLKAAAALEADGVSARVVDLFTWKPIDTELIVDCAEKTGAIVTAENHNIFGGLGSAVAEAVTQNCPVPMEFVGVTDRFGQVGTEDFLRAEYGLTAENVAAAAKRAIERK